MPGCKRRRFAWLSLAVLLFSAALSPACSSLVPVYPPRPAADPGDPIADPSPTRVGFHVTIGDDALRQVLEERFPLTGEGTVSLLGKDRRFTWKRDPLALHYDRGRVGVDLRLSVSLEMPVSHVEFPLDFRIWCEPVISASYQARVQSTDVTVSSSDARIKLANAAAGVTDKIQKMALGELDGVSLDLKPTVSDLYARVARPVALPLGDASGCAELGVLGIEAGPTVLANGIEKDVAFVVAPRVTLPCSPVSDDPPSLPPLANVATLQSGPFTVEVPVAARYEELAKAMSLAFTDGKLFFSQEYPKLYLEKPEVYASKDDLVLKLHVAGAVRRFFIESDIDGDIYFVGRPAVEDNELRVRDLEPTIETKSVLLKLKAALDGNGIRDEARAALRLDIGERLRAVRDKLSTDLAFADGRGCLKAEASKIEVTRIDAHRSYLRLYVAVTGRASVYVPCL
jgi:hypothetical protein